MPKTVVYIGGFELPDKNAAAQRVIGIAKGLRNIGYNVVFLNSIKNSKKTGIEEKEYFGFKCIEYKRENEKDYLFSASTSLSMIKRIRPDAVIAYNYPAVALNKIQKYCLTNSIKCYADVTEWYQSGAKNIAYRMIRNIDSAYRMKYVHKKMDGIIAISRYLYDYYKDSVKTVLIPPTVDLTDSKWDTRAKNDDEHVLFVYAGVPSSTKERLDLIVLGIEKAARHYPIILQVAGVDKEQFVECYKIERQISDAVQFMGRVSHEKVIEIVKKSDWSIILRENNLVVRAGFPTKVVESITCGTPVLSNRFSNVDEYLNESNCMFINNDDEIASSIIKACVGKKEFDRGIFDYHRFTHELEKLMN